MTTENPDAITDSGGEAVAAANETQPRNDAEAAQLEAERKAKEPPAPEPKPEDDQRKKNRTGEYIRRINDENRSLRERLTALESRIPEAPKPTAPDPEEFFRDPQGYAQRQAEFAVAQAREQWERDQQQQATQHEHQRVWQAYNQRSSEFALTKPDFQEVVMSIQFPLSQEVQAAIAAHESGPAIAYHLGLNDQDAFQLASLPPHLAAYAVEQIASRMKAAPPAGQTPPPSAPAAPEAANPKPISQAPAPAPRVGGRSPTEIPQEKMTDDEWYRADVERRRKR